MVKIIACTSEFIDFVCSQLKGVGTIRSQKMFGDWLIYVDEKPVILAYDNICHVKKLSVIAELMTISPYRFLYTIAICGVLYYLSFNLIGKHLDEIIKPSLWSILPFFTIVCYSDYKHRQFLAVTVLALSFLSFPFFSFIPKLIQSIGNKEVLRAIGLVGRNTLPKYLFYPIFTMGTKYALPFFSFDKSGVHIIFRKNKNATARFS